MSVVLRKLTKALDLVFKPLNDKRVAVPLTILLVLYSGLVAGSPPPLVRKMMASPHVRVLSIFVLALLMSRGDRTLALVSTIAVVVTMVAATNIDLLTTLVTDGMTSVSDVVEDVVDVVRGTPGPVKMPIKDTEVMGA
jgi:hypothetical protein